MSITQETSAGADAQPSSEKKRKPKTRIPLGDVSDDPDAVLTPVQWAELAGISIATARRYLADGTGPTVTKFTNRRIGIRRRDHAAWLDRLARPST